MTRLAILWENNANNFPTKIKLYKNIALWMSELDADGGSGEAKQILENKCYRRMLGISYRDHKTNEYVWQQVDILAGTSPAFTVNRHASQAIRVRPCLSS